MNTWRRHPLSRTGPSLLAASLLVLPVAACGGPDNDAGGAAKKEIRVDYFYPASGPYAAYGPGLANDAKLAVNEINKANPGFTIKLNMVDDQCDVTKATTLTTKTVRQKSADIIFGSFCAAPAYASATLATRAGIPVVVSGAQNPKLAELPDTFVTVPSTPQMSAALAKQIVDAGNIRTVAIQYLKGDYGSTILGTLQGELAKAGITVTKALPLEIADSNPLPFIASARPGNPDAVVLATSIHQIVPMLKAASETGWKPKFFGTTTAAYPNLENQAGPAANGMVRMFWFVNDNPNATPAAKAYLSSYKAAYGADPQYPSPSGYDGLKLVAQALKDAGAGTKGFNKDAFVKAMSGISYTGVVGEISFNEQGELKSAENIIFAESQDAKLKILP